MAVAPYWRLIAARAVPRRKLDWLATISPLVAVALFWWVLGQQKAIDELVELALKAGAVLLLLPGYVAVKLARAARIVHQELVVDRDHWKSLATEKQRKDDLVATVMPRLQYAIHDLYNRPPDSADDLAVMEWKRDVVQWEQDVKRLLESLGCTIQEKASFGI